jgi:hypothetical protein
MQSLQPLRVVDVALSARDGARFAGTVLVPVATSQSAMRSMSPVKAWNVCTGSSHKSGLTAAT